MTMYPMHTRPPAPSTGDTAAEKFWGSWPAPARIARERAAIARVNELALSEYDRDRVPAVCEYLDATHARASHPLGVDHPNCQLLIARLLKRNFTVTTRAA